MKLTKIAIKVTYGYHAEQFLILDNLADVEKAMYAKIEKIPVSLAGRFISGQEIKEIAPDVHSYTGWHRSYHATNGEDFAQIERDVPKVIEELIQLSTQRVGQFLANHEVSRIGSDQTPYQALIENHHE